jgi:hypothetical protein
VVFNFLSTSNGVLFSSTLACLDSGQLLFTFSECSRSSSAGRQLRGDPNLKKSLYKDKSKQLDYWKLWCGIDANN